MDIQQIKQRFGIIGNNEGLLRAIGVAMQVAPTDVSVLVFGESGVGKENMPNVIHHLSARKHEAYIAVNCGAIPEGTIDSELFGHEKGAFTGATDTRKGYFEEANGGTIFLDEVGELPLPTQARLLRVLETGEFIRVGSSKIQKTNVRIVAATNVNMLKAVKEGKFREDLYYRLNSVPIHIPPLRERGDDIHLLFRKFSADFSEKYHMPGVRLTEEAKLVLKRYTWPGNVRQLKNITEQISIIEKERLIDESTLIKYLPNDLGKQTPMISGERMSSGESFSERELLYKILFELKNDVRDLKNMMLNITGASANTHSSPITDIPTERTPIGLLEAKSSSSQASIEHDEDTDNHFGYVSSPTDRFDIHEEVEENFSLIDTEKELIKKALLKHHNKRKSAAKELGISERTLYRKIKEYNI